MKTAGKHLVEGLEITGSNRCTTMPAALNEVET